MSHDSSLRGQPPSTVAELQGLYGLFGFPEKLLQQLWARGEFDRTTTTLTDNRSIRIIHPGRWNLLGGPDFRDARVAIAGGPERVGDIELHLHAEDWISHAHASDPAYDKVILHVVLFPPRPGHRTIGADAAEIPVLPLLTALPRDLESYAADAVVEQLAGRPFERGLESLAGRTPGEVDQLLRTHAHQRWLQKVRFARLRLEKLGWEAACHHAALEVLGYRFNRAPMLRIAARFPLAEWQRGGDVTSRAYESERQGQRCAAQPNLNHGWAKQGSRPANYPKVRLEQYRRWISARPNWPALAERLIPNPDLPQRGAKTAKKYSPSFFADLVPFRGQPELNKPQHLFADSAPLRGELLRESICGSAVPATRFDNFITDALFPLVTAHRGTDFEPIWFRWPAGDIPGHLRHALRTLGVTPVAQGHTQGLLGCFIHSDIT